MRCPSSAEVVFRFISRTALQGSPPNKKFFFYRHFLDSPKPDSHLRFYHKAHTHCALPKLPPNPKLMQIGFSRQREWLAAVQGEFSGRNSGGLSGAGMNPGRDFGPGTLAQRSKVELTTTVMQPASWKMTAITGVNCPTMARVRPTRL